MKTSIRWWSRLALVAGMGLSTLIACSSDKPAGAEDDQRTGTLSLPLRTISNTGKLYFLRDAFFQIQNQNTGETRFISTEDGFPESGELQVRLPVGFYTVQLFDGWFLERFALDGDGGGTGGVAGSSSFGGTFTGGTFAVGGEASEGPFEGGAPSSGGSFSAGEGPVDPPIAGKGGVTSTGGTSVGGSGSAGSPGGGDHPIGSGERIPSDHARIVNGSVQFTNISPQSDSFVNFQFRVGDDVVDFNQGNLHISFFVDDVPACVPPEGATLPERVLLDSNSVGTSVVSLREVFEALATNGGKSGDAELLFNEVYDSFASAPGQVPEAKHCGDETTNGQPSLNGFRIDCDRQETIHVGQIDDFRATAFVNRIDLAPASGAHCGQQRMIFTAQNLQRSLMIVEAQIPNPHPELGIEGCRPLAEFWIAQNEISDPIARGLRLKQAFLNGGAPGLEEFGAFYTAENLTVGSGQIRLNTFNSGPWTLREFKLALDGENLTAVPFPVAESPNGDLWNENSDLPQGEACRENFLTSLEGVLTNDMSAMSFVVDPACKNSESRNDFSEDYRFQLSNSPGFRSQLEQKLLDVGSKLSPEDVANRARFSGSCIGCHQEARGSFLGDGVFAPGPSDFPQVLEFASQCGDDPSQTCFQTSNALKEVFLPGRMNTLAVTFGGVIPNTCDGGGGGSGTGGSSPGGFGGSVGMGTAGTFTAGAPSSGGSMSIPPKGEPEPAPVIDIELPSADEPVELLQEEDQEIREEYGDVTISGKSAASTH